MIEEAKIKIVLSSMSDDQLKRLQEKLIDYGIPRPHVLAAELKERKKNVGGFTLCGALKKDFLRCMAEVMTVEQLYGFNDILPQGQLAEILHSKPVTEVNVKARSELLRNMLMGFMKTGENVAVYCTIGGEHIGKILTMDDDNCTVKDLEGHTHHLSINDMWACHGFN